MSFIEKILLRIERFGSAFLAFILFMVRNLLISAAFLGAILLAFPNQFHAGLEAIRPIQSEAIHKSTMKLLMGNRKPRQQHLDVAGGDYAEVNFDTKGQVLVKENYEELYKMNAQRVVNLEAEILQLRVENRKLKLAQQSPGVPVPTERAERPRWSLRTMLGFGSQEGSSK